MDADELFLHTLIDLEARMTGPVHEYELLGIAALVRKLLLDDIPLVDQVNRERRLKLAFRVDASRPIWEVAGGPAPVFYSVEDGLDPETSLLRPQPADVKRDTFLAMPVMMVRGQWFTVKDVVLHVANVVGAVHRGTPRAEAGRLLEATSQTVSIGGYRPDVRTLQAIARVTVRALSPLRQSVLTDRPSPN